MSNRNYNRSAIAQYGKNCNVNTSNLEPPTPNQEGLLHIYYTLLERVSTDPSQLQKLRNFLLYCRSIYIPVIPTCNLFKNSNNLSLLTQYYMMLHDNPKELPYTHINLSAPTVANVPLPELFRFGNCLSNNRKFVVSFYPSIELQEAPQLIPQVSNILTEYYKMYEEAYRLSLIGLSDTHFTAHNFMELSYRVHHGLYYDKSTHPPLWVGYSDKNDSVMRFIEQRLDKLAKGISETCTGEAIDNERLERMISILGDATPVEKKIEEMSKHMFCKNRTSTSECATIPPAIFLLDYATAIVKTPNNTSVPYCWKKQLVLGAEKDYLPFNNCTSHFRIMLDPMSEDINCYPYIGYNMVMNRMYLRFAAENRMLLFPIKLIIPETTGRHRLPKLGRRVKVSEFSKHRFLGFIRLRVAGTVPNSIKTSNPVVREQILRVARSKNTKQFPMDKILMIFETPEDTSFNTRTGISNPRFMLYDWQLYKYYIGSLSPKMNVTYTEFKTLTKFIGLKSYLYTAPVERQIVFLSRYTPAELARLAPDRTDLYQNLVYMVIDYREFGTGNNRTNKSKMISYYKFIDVDNKIITDPIRMIDMTETYSKIIDASMLLTNYWDQIDIITKNINSDTC